MWMLGIMSTKMNDFSIAIDSHLFIFPAMLTQMTLHKPGFSMLGIDGQNTIEKNFGDVPAFFGYCTSRV